MNKEQIRQILDRVRNWPAERQADLAEVAMLVEAQDNSDISLSEDQAEEVRRRSQNSIPEPTAPKIARRSPKALRRASAW
jgi:hypothetical protein